MSEITVLVGDLKALTGAIVQSARNADWDAVTRYEAVRRSLVTRLSGIAAERALRPQVVDALRDVRQWGQEIGTAIAEARRAQDDAADSAIKSDRAGRAYAKTRTA